MRKITIYCDRCGKQVETTAMMLHTFTYKLPETEDAEDVEEGAELCEDCYKEIDDMIAFMVKNPTVHFDGGKQIGTEPDKPKPKHGGHNKKPLDLGRMAALRNAGWSYDKIAEDLRCSAQTVANRMEEAQAFLAKQNVKEDLAEALENDIQEV